VAVGVGVSVGVGVGVLLGVGVSDGEVSVGLGRLMWNVTSSHGLQNAPSYARAFMTYIPDPAEPPSGQLGVPTTNGKHISVPVKAQYFTFC